MLRQVVTHLKKGLVAIGDAFSFIISAVVLSVIFIFVIGAVHIVQRIFSRATPAMSAQTFWVAKKKPASIIESLRRQF